MSNQFKAILISRDQHTKKQSVDITQIPIDQMMEGDCLVEVEASTINYKDGLAITGKSPVVRHWPMIPGIDLAGTVIACDSERFSPGDSVLLNGFGVGETHWGAYAQYARLSSDWLILRPQSLSSHQAMGIGTAGYTAMLCVMALERHNITPENGPILVTGATGGVGSVAVALLSKLGFETVASTGKDSEAGFLKSLGASSVIDRNELSEPGRPLGKEIWAGAIDAVGSTTLANILAQTRYGGAVAACGLAQGFDLPTTVMPFILRNVSLLGIDSVMASLDIRKKAWARLERDLDLDKLEQITTTIGFDDIIEHANNIIDGEIRGRIVIDMKA